MADHRSNNCIICERALDHTSELLDSKYYFNCRKCGSYGISIIALEDGLLDEVGKIISYFLLRHPDSSLQRKENNTPVILSEDITKYKEQSVEPNALELLDNLLSYYCTVGKIGEQFQGEKLIDLTIAAKSIYVEAGEWTVKQAAAMGWFGSYNPTQAVGYFDASFEISAIGWQEFYKRQKNNISSKQAFLALQFNNEVLREIIVPEIKLACSLAGFELLAVDDRPKAGLIDDKIRVDIRNSRFVVVDISDQNQGAYFEAGFAEGLGKHVFYICDKTEFEKHFRTENKIKTIHFDVEHQTIIQWDKDNPKSVGEELLASIRNTLPNEAKMTD